MLGTPGNVIRITSPSFKVSTSGAGAVWAGAICAVGSAVPTGAVVSQPANRSETASARAPDIKRTLELAIREDDCSEVETGSARVVAMGRIFADGFRSEAQGVSCIC